MSNYNCLLCGVGGQGTVLASKLIALSAMNKGKMARTAETIGMAQRGGCVVSHVRTGDVVHSPMIPVGEADVIIGFEPGEAVRCLGYLKPDGVVAVSLKGIMPTSATLGAKYEPDEMIEYLKKNVKNLILVDTEKICRECGSPKVLNIALLGAAVASGKLGMTLSEMEDAIEQRVPEKFRELNKKALEKGANTYKGN